MKTFTDLAFRPHGTPGFGTQATMAFDNGFGVSVITGKYAHSSGGSPYELAVLHNGELTYDTPITDDVLGWLTEADVTRAMLDVQELAADSLV